MRLSIETPSTLEIRQIVSAEHFSKITGGYTGAQIECIINEAALLAAEDNEKLSVLQIQTVMNRMSFKALERNVEEGKKLEKAAVHEAGHAIVAALLCPEQFASASVIPQGQTNGHIRMLRNEVSSLSETTAEAENETAVALAGIAAEKVVYGNYSLSCEDDLEKAAAIVFFLITKIGAYGFDKLQTLQNRGEVPSDNIRNEISLVKGEVMDRMLSKGM